ncbi:TPA: hypothetical protein ACOD9X_004580 [Stenotrophomonas maltophilia]|uniref:hypothetical protein n=1 Tax=Stenotrophomonas maltophilia TaxID=40324 RepID=UPI00376846B4
MVETVFGMTDLQIKLFTACGQLAIGAGVGFVALRQWLTARNKLKADLYDRRYKLYQELESEVDRAQNPITRQEGIDGLSILARDVKWVFGEDVAISFRTDVLGPFTMVRDCHESLKRAKAAGMPQDEIDRMNRELRIALELRKRTNQRLREILDEHLTLTH